MYNTHTDTQAAQQLEMQIQRCRRTQKKFQIRCRFVPVRQLQSWHVIHIRESKQCFTLHWSKIKAFFVIGFLRKKNTKNHELPLPIRTHATHASTSISTTSSTTRVERVAVRCVLE